MLPKRKALQASMRKEVNTNTKTGKLLRKKCEGGRFLLEDMGACH